MKKIIFIMIYLLCIHNLLSADEIHYKNSKIVQCKIIQITDKTIEYSEPGGRPFIVEQKDMVLKVVYDDGTVVHMDGNNPDKIILDNGNIIEGTILQVTQDVLIYSPTGSEKKEAVVRENIAKIIYSNGQEVVLEGSAGTAEVPEVTVEIIEPAPVPEEPVIHTGGFIDSIFRFSLIGGMGGISGDVGTKENKAFDKYKTQVTMYPVYPSDHDTSITHDSSFWGVEAGLMFPAFKMPQTRGFALSGIKFGIIADYTFSRIYQSLYDRRLEDEDYSGRLMKYNTVKAGPEMNLIFSPKSNSVNFVVRGYLLGGYIHNGELTAVPGLRDADLSVSGSDYTTGFSGYSATAGAGLRFVSNLAFPVIIGVDLQYTYSNISFDHSLEAYDGADGASFHEIGFVVSAGIHI